MAFRFAGHGGWDAKRPFDVRFHPERLEQPLHWKKPRVVFVCILGDLFHDAVKDEWIDQIFAVMAMIPRHRFLVLTKRADRMLRYFNGPWANQDGVMARICDAAMALCDQWSLKQPMGVFRNYPMGEFGERWFPAWGVGPIPNVMLGCTVENDRHLDRVAKLLQTPAAKRWVSIEPMLSDMDIWKYLVDCNGCGNQGSSNYIVDYDKQLCRACDKREEGPGLDFCVVGGETGPGARPMDPEWARSMRDQCREAGVSFWFKKMGTAYDRSWEDGFGTHPDPGIPGDLLIREFPYGT
jgi:protein gp37